jgi:DNA-binding response OmpR family regulator
VQIILLTARQQEEDVLRGFQLGAEDYLTKPFSPLELVARVKRVVKR